MRSVTTVGGAVFAFAVAALRREELRPPREPMGLANGLRDVEFRRVHGVQHPGAGLAERVGGGDRHLHPADLGRRAGLAAAGRAPDDPARRRHGAGAGWASRCWSGSARCRRAGASCRASAAGLLAAAIFGLGTVVAKRHRLALPPVTSVAWQAAIGAIPLLVLALWERPDWSAVTPVAWLCCRYIMVMPLTVAYLAWFRALRFVPASTAATMVLISPLVGRVRLGAAAGRPDGAAAIAGGGGDADRGRAGGAGVNRDLSSPVGRPPGRGRPARTKRRPRTGAGRRSACSREPSRLTPPPTLSDKGRGDFLTN